MIREKCSITKKYKGACAELLQNNMASLRAKADLTQEELSNIIGCSRQTYYSIENQQREMSWSMLLSLCFIYHNLDATKEMLEDLKIYPIELFMKLNSKIDTAL